MYRVAIITASDSGSTGKRSDKSSEIIKEIVSTNGYEVVRYTLLPDDRAALAQEMAWICDNDVAHLILTTGGTGFSPRDVTPEATADIIERSVPGIPEAIRYFSLGITPRAMLSRATAGIRKETLIVNLPGSPKAVDECLNYVLPAISHGLDILTARDSDCGRAL